MTARVLVSQVQPRTSHVGTSPYWQWHCEGCDHRGYWSFASEAHDNARQHARTCKILQHTQQRQRLAQ